MKKQQLIFISLSIFISVSSFAQLEDNVTTDESITTDDIKPVVVINTSGSEEDNKSSAILQLNSSTQGFLIPRMTKLEREAIKAPAPGLQVFVTDFNNGKGAVMFYNGEEWTALANLIARPDPPTDVEATFTGAASDSSEVTVTFRAPENNGGSTITKYEVTLYLSEGKGFSTILSPIDNGPLYTKKFSIDIINNFYNFRVTATNKVGTSIASEFSNVVPDPQVGKKLFGGRVFYILNSADPGHISGQTRGLICADRDKEAKVKWDPNNISQEVTGTYEKMGHGKMNTQNIIDKLGEQNKSYAAYQATLYSADDGYTGWYLPSKDELNRIYQNLENYESMNFEDKNYWSSSEKGQTLACFYNLSKGTQGRDNKPYEYSVRPIRSF
jgi:hypothetical protein